jgi:hypothetical protein
MYRVVEHAANLLESKLMSGKQYTITRNDSKITGNLKYPHPGSLSLQGLVLNGFYYSLQGDMEAACPQLVRFFRLRTRW